MQIIKPFPLKLVAINRQTAPNKQPAEAEQYEHWLDKQDILMHLHISSRTLQRWRAKSLIVFTRMGGKIYYPKSALEMLLKKGLSKIVSVLSILLLFPEDMLWMTVV